jgi:putative nucleotidyltransferase with HDIG domain
LTATAARLLAGWRAPRQAEEAFVGGLLHDIGKVALVRGDAKEYVSVVEHARESGVAPHRAEEAVWGFDHATVGGLMLEQWRLPLEHQEAVRYHHQPGAAQVEPVLTALVSLSNEISHQVANDAEPDAAVLATCPAAKALRLTVTFLDDFLADVKARIARDSSQREDL